MEIKTHKELIEKRVMEYYNSVPDYIKDDICEAAPWAKRILMEKEGSGHSFQIYANSDGTVSCSFAKPQWAGDHSSRGMDHGAEAMVMAVAEYLNGA